MSFRYFMEHQKWTEISRHFINTSIYHINLLMKLIPPWCHCIVMFVFNECGFSNASDVLLMCVCSVISNFILDSLQKWCLFYGLKHEHTMHIAL